MKNRYLMVSAAGNTLKVKGEKNITWFKTIKEVQTCLSEHPLDLIGETVYIAKTVASCCISFPKVTTTLFKTGEE